MALDDYKHQTVRDDEQDYPSEGEWEYVVHDCHTPSMDEVKSRNASVETVWRCGNCGHRWKLINHTKHGTFGVATGQSTLVWRRITPIKDHEQKD